MEEPARPEAWPSKRLRAAPAVVRGWACAAALRRSPRHPSVRVHTRLLHDRLAGELQQTLLLEVLEHHVDLGAKREEQVLPQHLEATRERVDGTEGQSGERAFARSLARGGLMTQEGRGRSAVRQLALPSERNAASQCTTSWPRLSQHRWGPRAWVSEEEHGSPLGRQSSTEDGARGTTERRKRKFWAASWSP